MRAAPSGLRHPASALCLGRHSRLAGRCPNNSSLFPPLAAVVVVAAEKMFLISGYRKVCGLSCTPFSREGGYPFRQSLRLCPLGGAGCERSEQTEGGLLGAAHRQKSSYAEENSCPKAKLSATAPFFVRRTVIYYTCIVARKGCAGAFSQGGVSRARCTEKAVF